MKRNVVAALLVCTALAVTGCASQKKAETEAPATEAATETPATEAATEAPATEAATEAATTEAATEAATTEAAEETEIVEEVTDAAEAVEEETETAATEVVSEVIAEEEAKDTAAEETEAVEEETTEAATEEATEAATEEATEETTEAATEEATEAATEEETEAALSIKDLSEYTASDYVTLGDYKGLTIEVDPIEVTDDELTTRIESQTIETLTEGTVEEGDVANIDYVGKKDGVEFSGGSYSGYDLTIGSCTFIDGFEDGLIGVAIGDTVDLNLTFPEDYSSEELAGAEVVFTVTVNSVKRVPELTEETVKKIAEDLTVESYKDTIREEIYAEKEADRESQVKQEAIVQVYQNATITGYPQETLDYTVASAKSYYETVASYYGMTFADYLEAMGMTADDFMEQLIPMAQEAVGQEMVLLAVFEAENMEITEDEYQAGLERYATMTGSDAATLEETYGKTYLTVSMKQEEAMQFLYDEAVIVEKQAEEATEATTEAVTEKATEAATEEVTEAATEETTEAATEEVTEAAETEAVTEEVTEAATETETEAATTEAATETETETEAK